MGQKVSPIGFRTGIRPDWKSRWFAPKSNYGEFLVEDHRIRKFIEDSLNRQPPDAAKNIQGEPIASVPTQWSGSVGHM